MTEISDRVISAGIELIAAMTEAYGIEKGIDSWDAIAKSLGDEVRDGIFLAMLEGRVSGTVTILGQAGYRANTNTFVEFVKRVRNGTGFGLKEAKDICDKVDAGQSVSLKVNFKARQEFVRSLLDIGIYAK